MAAASSEAPELLAGIRVLDLADRLGAYGPRLLAGLGADVILVEPPGGGPRRTRLPRYDVVQGPEPVRGLYYLHYDAGKRGITLDIDGEAGREVLGRLLDTVDVVVDNGQLAARGFDLDALTASRALVVVSLTPFGLAGARSHWRGGDLICQVMGGMNGLYGFRDERPMRFGPEQASEMGGLAVALAALTALYGARADRVGEVVDIALERVAALVTLQMSNASVFEQFGVARQRVPRDAARERLFRARDGFVAFGLAREPRRAIDVLSALGVGVELEQLLQAHGEEQLVSTGAAEAAVTRAIQRVDRAAVVDAAQSRGVMAMAVQDADDILRDPFLQGRAFFVEVEHPEIGRVFTDAALPFLIDGRRVAAVARPPLLGEHTDAVLEGGGFGPADVELLRHAGVY